MSISKKDLKLLWGRSGNLCAICKVELSSDAENASDVFPLGHQAHIVAKNPKGPRGESSLTLVERNSYQNLILLCPTHHHMVDNDREHFHVDKLHEIKSDHELWVQSRLSEGGGKNVAEFRSMAPPINGFVPRSQYEEIVNALVNFNGQKEHPIVGITTALHGAGGFGKTALAQAVCQDKRVLQVFLDGILWVETKENLDEASLLGRIVDLIRWFTHKDPPHYTSVGAATAALRDILANHRVLVVVDDVWDPNHIRPFQFLGGKGSALLVTTRDHLNIPSLADCVVEVDAMHISEAVQLLGANVANLDEAPKLISLAYRLGEWPLLLKLVNRYLADHRKRGFSLAEAIAKAEADLDLNGLITFDYENSSSRNDAVEKTIGVSLQLLSLDEKQNYLRLAIFPEDADIPLSAMAKLCKCSLESVSSLCDRLYKLSLVLRFDEREGTIRLHDVFRAYLLRQHRRERLIGLHRALLKAYEPSEGRWDLLPKEEKYLWKHLAEHLIGAGQEEKLRDLLLDFLFINAKLWATDINQLISDAARCFEMFPEVEQLWHILRLSTHVLGRDKAQLASQIMGRLRLGNSPWNSSLKEMASAWRKSTWFRFRTPSLITYDHEEPLLSAFEPLESGGITTTLLLDNDLFLSGSRDSLLRVWSIKTGDMARILEGHRGQVLAATFVATQRIIISASTAGDLIAWDLGSGRGRPLEPFDSPVRCLDVWGERVLSGHADGTVLMWGLGSKDSQRLPLEHKHPITSLKTWGGQYILVGDDSGNSSIWDCEEQVVAFSWKADTGAITDLAIFNHYVILVTKQCSWIWNLSDNSSSPLATEPGPPPQCVAVAGKYVVFGIDIELAFGTFQDDFRLFRVHSSQVQCLLGLEDGRVLTGSDYGTMRLWDLERVPPAPKDETHITGFGYFPALDCIVSGHGSGRLCFWNLDSDQEFSRTLQLNDGLLYLAALNEIHLVVFLANGTLSVINVELGVVISSIEEQFLDVTALSVLDRDHVLLSSGDGRVRAINLSSHTVESIIENIGKLSAISVRSGRLVLGIDDPPKLLLSSIDSSRTSDDFHQLIAHSASISQVAFPSDLHFISISDDETLRVWDTMSGSENYCLNTGMHRVRSLAVLDEDRILIGSDDQVISLWRIGDDRAIPVVTLDAPPSAILVVGEMIVAGDLSGRVHFFDLVEIEEK